MSVGIRLFDSKGSILPSTSLSMLQLATPYEDQVWRSYGLLPRWSFLHTRRNKKWSESTLAYREDSSTPREIKDLSSSLAFLVIEFVVSKYYRSGAASYKEASAFAGTYRKYDPSAYFARSAQIHYYEHPASKVSTTCTAIHHRGRDDALVPPQWTLRKECIRPPLILKLWFNFYADFKSFWFLHLIRPPDLQTC